MLCGLQDVEMGFQFLYLASCRAAWPYIWASLTEHGRASPDSTSVWLLRVPLVSGSRSGSWMFAHGLSGSRGRGSPPASLSALIRDVLRLSSGPL